MTKYFLVLSHIDLKRLILDFVDGDDADNDGKDAVGKKKLLPAVVEVVRRKQMGKGVWKDARKRKWGEKLPPAEVAELESERQSQLFEEDKKDGS